MRGLRLVIRIREQQRSSALFFILDLSSPVASTGDSVAYPAPRGADQINANEDGGV